MQHVDVQANVENFCSSKLEVIWCVQNSGESRSMVKRKLACRVKTEAQVKEEREETSSDSDSVSNDQKLVEAFQKNALKMVTYVATS